MPSITYLYVDNDADPTPSVDSTAVVDAATAMITLSASAIGNTNTSTLSSGITSATDNKPSITVETVKSTNICGSIPTSSLKSQSGLNITEETETVAEAIAAITGQSVSLSGDISSPQQKGNDSDGDNDSRIKETNGTTIETNNDDTYNHCSNSNSNMKIASPSLKKNHLSNDKPRRGGIYTNINKSDHKNESTKNLMDDTIKRSVIKETINIQESTSKQNEEQLDQVVKDDQTKEIKDNRKSSSQASVLISPSSASLPPPSKALSETSSAIPSLSAASIPSNQDVENNGDNATSSNVVESDTSNRKLDNDKQEKERPCAKNNEENTKYGTARRGERKEQKSSSEQYNKNNVNEDKKKDDRDNEDKNERGGKDGEELKNNQEAAKSPSSPSSLMSSENYFDERMEKSAKNKGVISDEAMEADTVEKVTEELNDKNSSIGIAGNEEDSSSGIGENENEGSKDFTKMHNLLEMGTNRVTCNKIENSSPSPRLQRKICKNVEKAAKFQKEKQRIMSLIPMEIVRDFKEIGFTKWDGRYLCILQLGPYDVSPGEVRDQWMQMFKERSENGRPFSRLVYWYGADMSQAYSLIARSKIISYKDGVKRGLQNIPQDISRKINKRKRLSTKENFVVDNRKAASDDLTLPPAERSLWLFDFAEDHEEVDGNEVEDEEEDDDESSVLKCSSDEGENDNVAIINENSNDGNDCSSSVRISSSKKNSMARSVTNESDECRSPLHTKVQGGDGKKRRSRHSSSGNQKTHRSRSSSDASCENQKRKKKTRRDNDALTDVVDLRVLLKPIQTDAPKDAGDESDNGDDGTDDSTKRYNLQIVQNGALISESELQFSDPNESVAQQLKNQNITLNFAFKL